MAGEPRPWTEEQATRNTRARFEQWAHNPACEANTMSAVHNLRMDRVATEQGLPITFGASPFALGRGVTFERELFNNKAQRLIDALTERGVLPGGGATFRDLRLQMNYGKEKIRTLDEAISETSKLVASVAASTKPQTPVIVAAPTVRIPQGVMMPEANLIIDVMVVRCDLATPRLVVGEIKTYPDRAGHTDPHDLALARAQAGIYVHALDLLVEELGVDDKVEVSRNGFLTLTRPGSNWASVRPDEDLRYQAIRAKRGFELLESAALALPPVDGEPPTFEDVLKAILSSATSYSEACISFCDLAPKCFEQAYRRGDPVVLGEDARRFLGATSLHRLGELFDGKKPRDDAERDLMRRISESDATAA
jgi:hypothetical protein